jgi:hypothetical protein
MNIIFTSSSRSPKVLLPIDSPTEILYSCHICHMHSMCPVPYFHHSNNVWYIT